MFEAKEDEQDGGDDLGGDSIEHRRPAGQLHQHTQANDAHPTVVEPEEWNKEMMEDKD